MNSNSAIYMGDDGHYHDKPADELEQAPEPIEEGGLDGVQAPADDKDTLGKVLADPNDDRASWPAGEPKPATAKTRKQ